MKFPISYGFIIPLLFLILQYYYTASLFYPYILFTGVIGILTILFVHIIVISQKLRNYFYKIFPHSITKNIKNRPLQIIYFLIFILLKITLIYIWPENISVKSLTLSIFYIYLITLL